MSKTIVIPALPSRSLVLTVVLFAVSSNSSGDEPTWWALDVLRSPAIPGSSSSWIRTPVDAFVLEKLSANGLEPSPEADRRTLIRRLTFNLHGLPPSPEEIDAFVNDPSPRAHEELVDRLLASPRYGERWGRHWLDVVHYGETHGYDKDKRRPNAWPYRDYVIRAFNSDKPYARFVEEQLAGDVLFPDDPEGIVATGFIAAGPWDFVGHVELREGTVDKAIARSNDRDDMVAAAMSTFTSTTAHCARCHDHKFDPITQKDYYSLQAVFAGVDRADRFYDIDSETRRRRRELSARKQAVEARLAALTKAEGSPTNGYHSEILPAADHARWVEVDLGREVAVDEVLLVPARPTDFPDTPGFGFPLRFKVEAAREEISASKEVECLADHTARDFANPGDAPVKVPGRGVTARRIRITATRLWERTNDFVFALAELEVWSGGRNAALGARVTAQDTIEAGRWARANLVDGYSSRSPLKKDGGQQADAGRAQTQDNGESLASAQADLKALNEELASLPPERVAYTATSDFRKEGNFSPAKEPRPVHFLHRGDVKTPGDLMGPGALACVSGLESRFELASGAPEGARRAALARWITDRRNPLTWRSIVNRVWQYHFGRGIVDSPNDFGRMGEKPTHPELLDWLAAWFRDSGGSLKDLHRLILKSSVYRQSSAYSERGAKLDADNRWLWRMARSRLEAEGVRDALLAASGKLDLTMGGPSADHFFFKDDHSPTYDYTRFDVDTPSSFRRSVYRFIVRSVPDPFMECLDCADPSILTAKRNNTLTALQALALLNTPFAVRQAEHFASRLRALTTAPGRQIEMAYLIALGRKPTAEESRLLLEHSSLHGLENVCRLIFNSNEFLFID